MKITTALGCAVGVALAAILVLHGCKRESPKLVPVPTTHTVVQAAPAPKEVRIPVPKANPRKAEPAKPKLYHRVGKGGKIDGTISCKEVPLIADQYPPDKVIAYAKKLGMTPGELSQLRACLN